MFLQLPHYKFERYTPNAKLRQKARLAFFLALQALGILNSSTSKCFKCQLKTFKLGYKATSFSGSLPLPHSQRQREAVEREPGNEVGSKAFRRHLYI